MTKEKEPPIIIATNGDPHTGKKLVANTLAAKLDCLLINEENLSELKQISFKKLSRIALSQLQIGLSENFPESLVQRCLLFDEENLSESKQVGLRELSQIVLSQLQIGVSVVIDSDISHDSVFFILRDLAIATETPLFIVECKPCQPRFSPNHSLEDFSGIVESLSAFEYDIGDTPKLFVNVETPTLDCINGCIPNILNDISIYIQERNKRNIIAETQSRCKHMFYFGKNDPLLEDNMCNRCSKQMTAPIFECSMCKLVLHKTCTHLPSSILIFMLIGSFTLEEYGDDNDKVRCSCCRKLVNGYAYASPHYNLWFDLNCFFTPKRPGINLHFHELFLYLKPDDFTCQAYGSLCKQKLHYSCNDCVDKFQIGINSDWLKESAV